MQTHAARILTLLALPFLTASAAASDELTCMPVAGYAERVAASEKLVADDKGCISQTIGRLDLQLCKGDTARTRSVTVATKGSGEKAALDATHVMEWSSALELKNDQGFGYNLSGIILFGGGQVVSIRYIDYWRDDPTVANARQVPVDRVDIAQGPAGRLTCDGAGKLDVSAVMAAVENLHRPKPKPAAAAPAPAGAPVR